jgi:hypothetical protein
MTTRVGMMLAHLMNRKQEDVMDMRLVGYCPLSPYQRFCHPSCNWWNTVRCTYPDPVRPMAIDKTEIAVGARVYE